jgi:hypothetical protein
MADLPNRDELEGEFARKLGRASREILNKILDILGDKPDLSKITEDVWIEIRQLYEAVVIGGLEKIFAAAAQDRMDTVGVGVDWTLVNEQAARWATEYGFDLVRGMTDNRRRFLQNSIADFNRTGMTMGDLRERLSREFGVVRAAAIAETETTRAASEGRRVVVRELEKNGVRFRKVIRTNEDSRVCPICGQKVGKNPDEVGYPPYHVKCRCWDEVEAVPLEVAV